jgi:nicotinate-nucleotide pyrophosphorylase (carboxylating)
MEEKLLRILAEDIGQGDITASIVPSTSTAKASVLAKESGVVAGTEEAKILAENLGLRTRTLVTDGDQVKDGQVLIRISGDARTILSAERTLLNIMSRMSGIATATSKVTEKLRKAHLRTKVACTRKTAPGLLYFDKKAAWIGGGDTHRLHLDDLILIKDNHIKAVGTIGKAVKEAREKASFAKKIEVEVASAKDALIAADAGADIIMFDNLSPEGIREAIRFLKKEGFGGKLILEASGRITEDNVVEFASTGVDVVSLGEITDSSKALDLSLEIMVVGEK